MAACFTDRRRRILGVCALFAWAAAATPACSGVALEWRGEASARGRIAEPDRPDIEARLRYVPEALMTWAARPGLSFDADVAGEVEASAHWPHDAGAETRSDASSYRLWVGAAGPATEVRAGLQRIDFGSASLLRPLMWFDSLDPRDPLRVTKGVWAVRARQSLPLGAGLWAWGVQGDGERRGWDLLVSSDDRPGAGGRLQLAVPRGELAGAYHHRTAQLALPGAPGAPSATRDIGEDRYGFDGRWDVGVGAWLEGSWTRLRDAPFSSGWQRALCAGGDYTFRVFDGVTVTAEHMRVDLSERAFQRGAGRDLSALAVLIRLGVLDTVRGFTYRDWESGTDSQVVELRRAWDHWSLHLLGFRGGDALGAAGPGRAFPTGDGGQLMLSYQHGTESR